MVYYVVSDCHGFFTELYTALKEAGFFEEKEDCRLVVCGDVLDRGKEAIRMINFLLHLKNEGKLILITGNHEELLSKCLQDISRGKAYEIASGMSYHYNNGTWDTILQLANMNENDAIEYPEMLVHKVMQGPFYRELIPFAKDYYETEHYIFTHGWIPCEMSGYPPNASYRYLSDWRNADYSLWYRARWNNGMVLACEHKIIEPGKTIVCGHWHTSFGHSKYENKGTEFEEGADFSPFSAEGILALDGCVAYTKKVNCVVIRD